jgi:CRP-like cAMP-binding protein
MHSLHTVFLKIGESRLVRKGEPLTDRKRLDGLYYVIHGGLSVEVLSEEEDDNRSTLLYRAGCGSIVGVETVFGSQPFDYLVTAEVESCVATISKGALRKSLIAMSADVRAEVLEAILVQVSSTVLNLSKAIASREFRKVEDRVYLALLDLLKSNEELGNRTRRIAAPRAVLAQLARCSREMTTYALNALEDQGIVKVLKGSLVEVLPANHLRHTDKAQLAAKYGFTEQALRMSA